MAINTSAIETFVNNIGQAGNTLDVANLGLTRTVSKKFAKMLGGVKSKTATVGTDTYTLTAPGAVAMFEMLDEGESLAPSYDASGALDIENDVTKDAVIFGGTFESKKTTTTIINGEEVVTPVPSLMTVEGKNVVVYDATITDYSRVTLSGAESIIAEGCVIDNRAGTISDGKNNQNSKKGNKQNSALISYDCNPKSIAIKDMKVYASNASGAEKIYNGIELWGGSNTKSILVENCQFLGTGTNNSISIYTYGDNCVVTIKDCYIQKTSNVLRISNDLNSTGIVVNFENCIFDSWEGDTATEQNKNDWAGLVICQDYTSSAADAATNNRFGKDANGKPKFTINIKNCVGPNNTPIQIASGKTYADYCNSGLADQVCYVWRDQCSPKLVAFDADAYPVFNITYTAAPTVVKGTIPA